MEKRIKKQWEKDFDPILRLSVALLALLLVVLALSFTACEPTYFEGEVCELEFKEAYTTTTVIPITIYNGKTTSIIMVPYVYHYPDRWFVKVKSFDEEKQKFIYNSCYVTKECFETLKIGDWFVYNEDYCFDEEPCIKERAE